ncbi:MAG: hypothetical protein ABIK93_00410 [candidate division WOR-3 bacterium]
MKKVNANLLLVAFKMKSNLTPTQAIKIRRKLYGYTDFSQFGKYRYSRAGILAQIPHQRILPGVILIEQKDLDKILKVLKGKAKLWLAEYKKSVN